MVGAIDDGWVVPALVVPTKADAACSVACSTAFVHSVALHACFPTTRHLLLLLSTPFLLVVARNFSTIDKSFVSFAFVSAT